MTVGTLEKEKQLHIPEMQIMVKIIKKDLKG